MKTVLFAALIAGFAPASLLPAALASTYAIDDGTAENSVGLTFGGTIAGINAFSVTSGLDTITSVEVAFGTPAFAGMNGIIAGTAFNYYVWANTGAVNDAPSAATALLLFSGSSTIDAANIDNNTFQSLAVPSIVVPGMNFFVGVSLVHIAGQFPLSVDQSIPTLSGASWAAGGASFDANNVGFGGGAAFDLTGLNLGNWMIRATAIPAPSAFALLGLGGLVAGRRRR